MKLDRRQIKRIQKEFEEKRASLLVQESQEFSQREHTVAKQAHRVLGTVIAVRGSVFDVQVDKNVFICRGGKRADYVVGDRVALEQLSETEGRLQERLARRSWFVRGVEFAGSAKVIAANIDQLVIIASAAQPDLKEGLLDRFLVLAEYGRLSALICVNKMDLGNESEIRGRLLPYEKLGYEIIYASAVLGTGLEILQAKMALKTSVLVGHSGVGKSTLINHIKSPDAVTLTTGAVNPKTLKGRHTTTSVYRIELAAQTVVLDTPGVRDVGLSLLSQEQITAGFIEIAALIPYCRFNNCQHRTEPDCAVLAALATGAIDPGRYQHYLEIMKELPKKFKI